MSDREPSSPRRITVPGSSGTERIEGEPEFDGLVDPRDLGSASRSCLAIIVVLLIIALLLCVFLVGTIVM